MQRKIGETSVCMIPTAVLPACVYMAMESSSVLRSGDRRVTMVITGGISRTEGGECGSDPLLFTDMVWGDIFSQRYPYGGRPNHMP